MFKEKSFGVVFLSVLLGFFVAAPAFAGEAKTIKDAVKDGKFSGTIGSYFEHRNNEAENSDYGWATGYFTLKYETLRWNGLKLGGRVFAHVDLYSDHDNGTTDPFEADVESMYTVPEIYLDYSFLGDSSLRVGRWDHQKVSHIDDVQSEGGYLLFNELPGVKLTFGVMKRFAEIDYDDGEDFGRKNNAQDLDSKGTYGANSKPVLLFAEAKKTLFDMVDINPYVMYQKGYASVYGIDTDIKYKIEDLNAEVGGRIDIYTVDAQISGSKDAKCFALAPYIKKGPITLDVGFAKFDDDNSLNKPAWLRDYLLGVNDQLIAYGQAGSDVYFGRIKYSKDKFWTHFVYVNYDYDLTSSMGDRLEEKEVQFGYEFTKNFDVNIRLFDVKTHGVDNKDYQKIETRVRFRF
ncbi:hypothetical protein ACFL96_15740 [Thermoproteota archaeon]